MLKISRLADYGSSVMRYLAYFSYFADQSKSAVEVAEGTHLALPTVRKILKLLLNSGLLVSLRGKEGGYRLSRDIKNISLADIIEAIDGPIALTECSASSNQEKHPCGQTPVCTMRKDWQWINFLIKDALSKQSLEKLCHGAVGPEKSIKIDRGELLEELSQ